MNPKTGIPFLSITHIDALTPLPVPVNRKSYRILIINSGSCNCQIDKMETTIDNTSMAVVKPNIYLSVSPGTEASGYIISFCNQFLHLLTSMAPKLQRLPIHLKQAQNIRLTTEEQTHLTTLTEKLAHELHHEHDKADTPIIHALFQVFAFEISRLLAKQAPLKNARCSQLLMRFYSLLDEHFASFKQPFQYASMMYITPNQLNNIIKTTLGCTASTIIQERIVTEAKMLIAHNNLSMKEVAFKLGFEDMSHFSRFFKKVAGTSFSSFRKEIQLQN
ncbi:helix-turn-helix domain-containing protein [Filimonas lacunae]|nr:helix-turn-helix domain-containing protein [Filimonas lacunae]